MKGRVLSYKQGSYKRKNQEARSKSNTVYVATRCLSDDIDTDRNNSDTLNL